MSTYLDVSNAELQALARDLQKLLGHLEAAMAAGTGAGRTPSWSGPAATRYRSEYERHRGRIEKNAQAVREAIATVRRDINLSNEAKAAERLRLARLEAENRS